MNLYVQEATVAPLKRCLTPVQLSIDYGDRSNEESHNQVNERQVAFSLRSPSSVISTLHQASALDGDAGYCRQTVKSIQSDRDFSPTSP